MALKHSLVLQSDEIPQASYHLILLTISWLVAILFDNQILMADYLEQLTQLLRL